MLTKRSRHFRVRLAYVKQQLMDGVMFIEYINTLENIADLFTKPLAAPKFLGFRNKLVHSPMTSSPSVALLKPYLQAAFARFAK